MRNGWLREVDEHTTREILNLLRSDPAVIAVPFNPEDHWRELDFSESGAQLYRMVSSEIFGSEWEDGLIVEDLYYREEHRYCATEEGVAAITREYAEFGEVPNSAHTVAIGPWCVYWWRRFRSGYRLELTFGEL
jgi:hypothetical protein